MRYTAPKILSIDDALWVVNGTTLPDPMKPIGPIWEFAIHYSTANAYESDE